MSTRRIILSGLALDAHIGILEHERRATQPLHIDAEFDIDIMRAVDDHDILGVLDYRRLREVIVQECTRAHVNLIETLIDQVAARLLAEFAEIRHLRLRISKPMAFSDCAAVAIEIQHTR
jgi:7,8-dihydroneopterin aldolase/epimerase/oxygenase